MSEHMSPIPSRLYNAAVGGHVCGPEDVDFGQKVVHLIKYDRAGNEVSFESQVTQANKIYVIHDDFTLSSNVTIPANCVLEFNGGSISGEHTITGNNTELCGNYIFNDVLFDGDFVNTDLYITIDNFKGNIDFEGILHSFKDSKIVLHTDIEQTTLAGKQIYNIQIEGNGHTIKMPSLTNSYAQDNKNIYINNVVFDMSLLNGTFLDYYGNNSSFVIKNCKITNLAYAFIIAERCDNPVWFNNTFEGTLTQEDTPGGAAILAYNCSGIITITNNKITNYRGTAINVAHSWDDLVDKVIIENNYINSTGKGGVIIFDSFIRNINIENNTIINTNVLNQNGTIGAAINVHGFNGLYIVNNSIFDCNSNSIDLEGSRIDGSSQYRDRGINAFVEGNVIKNCRGFAISNMVNAVITNNDIVISNIINFMESSYITFKNNIVLCKSTEVRAINLGCALYEDGLGECHIEDNDIETYFNNYWLYIGLGAAVTQTEKIYISNNKAYYYQNKTKLLGYSCDSNIDQYIVVPTIKKYYTLDTSVSGQKKFINIHDEITSSNQGQYDDIRKFGFIFETNTYVDNNDCSVAIGRKRRYYALKDDLITIPLVAATDYSREIMYYTFTDSYGVVHNNILKNFNTLYYQGLYLNFIGTLSSPAKILILIEVAEECSKKHYLYTESE